LPRSYISKNLQAHGWTGEKYKTTTTTPLPYDGRTIKRLQTKEGTTNDQKQQQLAQTMGLSYKQAIRELLFPVITCRPDILYACIKLSCYSN